MIAQPTGHRVRFSPRAGGRRDARPAARIDGIDPPPGPGEDRLRALMPAHPVIDAHLHLWDPKRLSYPWLAEVPTIAQVHGPSEFEAARGEAQVECFVFVQCDCLPAQQEQEALWVSELARGEPRLGAIVAGLQVERGDAVRAQLEAYASNPLVKGVRRLIQSETDPGFCEREDFVSGVARLAEADLSFDLCLHAAQLEGVVRLVRRLPHVRFVLDHLGKPDIRGGGLDPWRARLRDLAELPNVWAKVSGLVTEADPAAWTADGLRPYVEHAVECFGFERLMFGGDWPVSRLACTYPEWVAALDEILAGISAAEGQRFWRGTAAEVYRLTVGGRDSA